MQREVGRARMLRTWSSDHGVDEKRGGEGAAGAATDGGDREGQREPLAGERAGEMAGGGEGAARPDLGPPPPRRARAAAGGDDRQRGGEGGRRESRTDRGDGPDRGR